MKINSHFRFFTIMNQQLFQIALVVSDYDEAINFYTQKLGFELLEDTALSQTKRWVVVKPKGDGGCRMLLAKAANAEQKRAVGAQAGGRVFLFLHTDDIERDYKNLKEKNVKIVREFSEEPFGKVLVFEDLDGNLWDLIEPPYSQPLFNTL
ncbi:MAG TPA: VOC family protein [Flavisolibacter sp.]|nr:VOC family protein [Flavisolibacter sp.]